MSIGKIGSYFDERAANWVEQAEPAGTKHLMIAQLASVHGESRVLDVGCGAGIMERAYLELGASSVVALDVSSEMIRHARMQFEDVPEDRLRFECQDVIDFEDDEPFDVVVIYNAYPHILDKKALVKAAASLLVPGGRFLVAHGMSRETLNAHHANVPHDVTSDLLPAKDAALDWQDAFDIDMMADTPFTYFFGGSKR